jgi:hypothetical protein
MSAAVLRVPLHFDRQHSRIRQSIFLQSTKNQCQNRE